jgi:hypothetical protein
MTDIHHIGIRVLDLDQAIAVLEKAFDVRPEHDPRSPDGVRRIAYITFANCRLELVQDPAQPLPDGQLAAIDHIAIASNNIDRDMDELSTRGFPSMDQAPRDAAFGHSVAAYDLASFYGIKIHLVSERITE